MTLPKGIDSCIWKILGKKCIMHYHGSELRHKRERILLAHFPYRIFVSIPDLLDFSKRAIFIPNGIFIEQYPFVGVPSKSASDEIIIAHLPSNRSKKGTEFLFNALKRLNNEGMKVNLLLIENLPHPRAIELLKRADIVIDQLLIGWYGMVSIESMALGKPVCSFIRKDLISFAPECPVFNITSNNLFDRLRDLIQDSSLRQDLSIACRKFVEKFHDANKIAKTILSYYNNV